MTLAIEGDERYRPMVRNLFRQLIPKWGPPPQQRPDAFGLRSGAEQNYLKILGGLRTNDRALRYDLLDTKGRSAVFEDAVALVRLVDTLYIASDPNAHTYAVHFDDYGSLLLVRGDELARHALHDETRAAIEEARRLALRAQRPRLRP